MKARCKGLVAFLVFLLFVSPCARAGVIEEIYAIVNDEIITGSELKNFEKQMTRAMQAQYEGQKLADAVSDMKKNLLNMLIEQKVLQSKIKEKNYNVDADVELIIQEIKKQNNMSSDDDLKKALNSEGIDFNDFKDNRKERRRQQRLIWEEIGSKIKIDNSQIMEYLPHKPAQIHDTRRNIVELHLPEEGKRYGENQGKNGANLRRIENRQLRRSRQKTFGVRITPATTSFWENSKREN